MDEMVKVGDFWIDRYETGGELIESPGANAMGYPSDWVDNVCSCNNNNRPCRPCANGYDATIGRASPLEGVTEARAISFAGAVPATGLTWFQAAALCAHSGKRLCTNAEWQTAASGTPDPGDGVIIPGGRARLDACNVASDPGRGPHASASGTPAGTGAHADCVSRFGAYDMIGNLEEPTADWSWWAHKANDVHSSVYGGDITVYGTGDLRLIGNDGDNGDAFPAAFVRGGYYGEGTLAGAFHLALNRAPSAALPWAGARCCAGGP
jgi:formylglycine-generating enzyme required for sulfatase activity